MLESLTGITLLRTDHWLDRNHHGPGRDVGRGGKEIILSQGKDFMAKNTYQSNKRLFGMTVPQIIVLFVLGLLTIAIMGFAVFLIFGISLPDIKFPAPGLSNQANAIIGRWGHYTEPTPTRTPGPTETPIVMLDMFGTPYVVVPPDDSTMIHIGCDFGYPPTIEFFADKTYVGTSSGVWSNLFVWQGGQYEILEASRIKMQTKNGYSVYGFSIGQNILTFTDDSQCQFRYQRISATTTISMDIPSATDTAPITPSPNETATLTIQSPTPSETDTPIIQPSPSRTKAPTWTLLPQMVTPSRTMAPTWTPIP